MLEMDGMFCVGAYTYIVHAYIYMYLDHIFSDSMQKSMIQILHM